MRNINFTNNFKTNLFYYFIILLFYSLYFYLIGSDDKDGFSVISFDRNDTFFFHNLAIFFKKYYQNGFLINLDINFDIIYLFYINIWIQAFFYLFKESLWLYLFFICFLVMIIHFLSVKVFSNLSNSFHREFQILSLLFFIIFPSFIYSALILGKDLYIIIILLFYVNFLTSKSKINNYLYSSLFFVFIFFQLIILRHNLFLCILIFTNLYLIYRYILKILIFKLDFNSTLSERLFFLSLTLICSYLFYLYLFDFSSFISSQYSVYSRDINFIDLNSDINSIKFSYLIPDFLNKQLNFIHYLRENFNNYQVASLSDYSVYYKDYDSTIGLITHLLKNLFISIIYPSFLLLDNSKNLLFFLSCLESLAYLILLTLCFYSRNKFQLLNNLFLFIILSFFFSLILFVYPNIGTYIRYKVIILPVLLIFAFNNIVLINNKSSLNYLSLISNSIYKNILSTTLLILMFLSFIIRDYFFLSFLDYLDIQKFIIYSTFLTFYLNIFHTLIIDIGYKNKKLINRGSFIGMTIILIILILKNEIIILSELLLIIIIGLSSIFNSNILSSNLDKLEKNYIFTFNILLNFLSLLVFKYIQLSLINCLIYISFVSVSANIIFFKKFKKININLDYQNNLKLILNQILIMVNFVLIIFLSTFYFKENPLSSYSLKIIYSLFFSIFLSIKILYLDNYQKFLDFFKNSLLKINIFSFFIFILIFIGISLLKVLNLIQVESLNSFYLLIIFSFVLFINLSIQKLVYSKNNFIKPIIISNLVSLIILICFFQIKQSVNLDHFFTILIIVYLLLPFMFIIKILISKTIHIKLLFKYLSCFLFIPFLCSIFYIF